MSKRAWVIGGVVVLALAGGAVATRTYWIPSGSVAQPPRGPQGPRTVPVEVAVAAKKRVPVLVNVLGTVTPIASVAIKSRIETVIVGVHFADGADVREGELLFTLDGRQIEAQIRQVEAVMAGAKAQLEQAQRDVERQAELMTKNATTQVALQNARTQVNIWRSTADSSAANLENLKVQLGYCTIRAPISGRASMAAVKVGNFVRPADPAPLVTINQITPVYVTFSLPQGSLPELREAIAGETATVAAVVPGDSRRAEGQVTMIENAVDAATGMVAVRATMPNAERLLWPGTLVTVKLTLREEDAITVPPTAVQVSQTGSFVFVVKDGAAFVQPVEVARVMESETVIAGGLEGGETVVTDGQLRLTNGIRVAPRRGAVGS
jgi:membrane fusion protein, multidrug efflux system